MWKNASIKTKCGIFSAIVAIVSVAVTATVCLWAVKHDLLRQANITLGNRISAFEELLAANSGAGDSGSAGKPASFRIEDEKLVYGSLVLNDNHDLVDKVKHVFGGAATVFMKDIRVSTNILTESGRRAVGTKLQQGPAYAALFDKGESYRGETSILGVPYIAAYDPIKNSKGEVIGVLFVGAPKSDFFKAFYQIEIIVIIVAIALTGIIIILVPVVFGRATKPLVDGVSLANRLAEGDLTVEIEARGRDEVGQLLGALRDMTGKWRSIVENVAGMAAKMTSASTGLSASAEHLSEGSTVQVDSVSQLAAASSQMTESAREMAASAERIARSSSQAMEVAKHGRNIVNKSVQEVREISVTVEESGKLVRSLGEKSAQIGEIVGVINEIADQTNLLALNAAIEAARAGEHGRGFAVVADEVRKLAERTAGATAEIAGMIGTIQDEVKQAVGSMEGAVHMVESGVELSTQAGGALNDIMKAVDELQAMAHGIASATIEMTGASGRVGEDIERIASVSREVSVGSEETNRAASGLSAMSSELLHIVEAFRLPR